MADIYKYDIFLSYATRDIDFVRSIENRLTQYGFKVFFADESLKQDLGKKISPIIYKKLLKSQHFLLICTKNSINSDWVKDEYTKFIHQCESKEKNRRFLILINAKSIDIKELPEPLRTRLVAYNNIDKIIQNLTGIIITENKRIKGALNELKVLLQNHTKQLSNLEKKIEDMDNKHLEQKISNNTTDAHLSRGIAYLLKINKLHDWSAGWAIRSLKRYFSLAESKPLRLSNNFIDETLSILKCKHYRRLDYKMQTIRLLKDIFELSFTFSINNNNKDNISFNELIGKIKTEIKSFLRNNINYFIKYDLNDVYDKIIANSTQHGDKIEYKAFVKEELTKIYESRKNVWKTNK